MRLLDRLRRFLRRVRLGVDPRRCPRGTVVLLPRGAVVLRCGIAALVEISDGVGRAAPSFTQAAADLDHVLCRSFDALCQGGVPGDAARAEYLGGDEVLDRLTTWARGLKRSTVFADLVEDDERRREAAALAERLGQFAADEQARLREVGAALAERDLELFSARVLRLEDVAWHVESEALGMVEGVLALCGDARPTAKLLVELRRVLAVLRSIDRIEIRGRDSAGLAVQVVFERGDWFRAYLGLLEQRGLSEEARRRSALADLPALAIALSGDPEADDPERPPTVTFVYKVAAEVGRLGDNVAELSRQIAGDAVLRAALSHPGTSVVALGHTRWASSGVISVPNCHPVDNSTYTNAAGDAEGPGGHRAGRVFVVMNGDVDNHIELRSEYDAETGRRASPRVTTDTKVVALQIEREIAAGASVADAFRLACRRFTGSCAIGMITDLAPGKLFLSLKGSGQSLYVGLSEDGFFASSEVYGVVEETSRYVKLDGEAERVAGDPSSCGEMVIASSAGPRGPGGLHRLGLDGVDLPVSDEQVRRAEITTRDVDRGEFEHFFRKEITQASRSASRTLLGRATPTPDGNVLSKRILSDEVRAYLREGNLRLIYVVGQGTAAVAGRGFSEYLRRVVEPAGVRVEAMPATEMSGFRLRDDMSDTLVVAVTQSGSTADTNRAVDLARKRGARVVAVVNRRNSDITFRADSVVYTSDGRDVEMSVASTKAFYAQIVAGGLLALAVARELGTLDDDAASRELDELCRLPELMQRVLDNEGEIQRAAATLAPTREHWAVVASGPNQVAAEEVRIKLSELCYKSIAVDTVENKKHIDLSSEPLILVLAAGNPESVLNDVIKDVAIFIAHKAVPIVFAHEGETRFDPYASAVVHLPVAPPLSSMVLCALAGHLFGYHAARAIDENARFLHGVRSVLVEALEEEVARETLADSLVPLRREYLDRLGRDRFTSSLHPVTAVQLAMLFDRATGAAVSSPDDRGFLQDDENDVVATFVNTIGAALDQCARPIDAIKHQAKIVTVGTSRPEEELQPIFAEALAAAGLSVDGLAPIDVLDLRRLAPAVELVEGMTRYEIRSLRADGSPGVGTRIRVAARHGVAESLGSRLADWGALVGTKRQVAARRHLTVTVGRGDGRRIAILPLFDSGRKLTGLLLLHLVFAPALGSVEKERVLGGRLQRLKDLVAEANRSYSPEMLDGFTPEELVLEHVDDLAERALAES